MLQALEVQMWNVSSLTTTVTGQVDFSVVQCSVTDIGLPSSSQFCSQDNVVKGNNIWENIFNVFACILYGLLM
jgi:hypothetical protein